MNFLQKNPFFRLFIALSAGILFFQYFQLNLILVLSAAILALVVLFTFFLLQKSSQQFRWRWLPGVAVFILLFLVGYSLSDRKNRHAPFDFTPEKSVYAMELTQTPIEKAKSYKCEVKLLSRLEAGQWLTSAGKAVVYIQKDSLSSRLLYGDQILGYLRFQKPVGKVNPAGFDYAAYLGRQGIKATAYLSAGSWEEVGYNGAFSVFRVAGQFRNKLLQIYRNFGIAGDEYAVLSALTLGFTDALQPDLRANYSATGAMHILSVSGLHVGIIYVVIAFLLSFMQKSKRLKILRAVLIVSFLWMYAFVTGLSPSVIRSAFMFSLVAVGSALDRKSQIYNTVFMSAFFMLLIDPDFLFDVGFQLSYAAVLSIVFFQKPFVSLFPVRTKAMRWLRDLVAVSVAAQLGTLPVTLYYFQQFPNYFILTNIVAIPVSTLVIYLAIVLLLFHWVPVISTGIAFLLKWSVWLLNFLIAEIEHLPYSVSGVSFDFARLCLTFIALSGIVFYVYSKKYTALALGLSSLALVFMIGLKIKWNTLNSDRIVLYSSANAFHLNLISSDKNTVYTTDSTDIRRIATNFWRQEFVSKPVFYDVQNIVDQSFVSFAGEKILVANESWWKRKSLSGKLSVDLLIIGNKCKPKIAALLDNVQPRKVVVDATISEWYTESVRQECERRNIPFYSVTKQGAYVQNFTD